MAAAAASLKEKEAFYLEERNEGEKNPPLSLVPSTPCPQACMPALPCGEKPAAKNQRKILPCPTIICRTWLGRLEAGGRPGKVTLLGKKRQGWEEAAWGLLSCSILKQDGKGGGLACIPDILTMPLSLSSAPACPEASPMKEEGKPGTGHFSPFSHTIRHPTWHTWLAGGGRRTYPTRAITLEWAGQEKGGKTRQWVGSVVRH